MKWHIFISSQLPFLQALFETLHRISKIIACSSCNKGAAFMPIIACSYENKSVRRLNTPVPKRNNFNP